MKQYTIKIHVSVVAGMLGFEMWKNVKRRRRLGFEAGISEHMSVHKEKRKSTTGLEPAISRFVGGRLGRLIHWATRTWCLCVFQHNFPPDTPPDIDKRNTENEDKNNR